TASRPTGEALAARLRELGAEVCECPAIETRPPSDAKALDAAVSAIAEFTAVAVTSAAGAHALAEALERARARSGRAAGKADDAGPVIAAVGEATAEVLRKH